MVEIRRATREDTEEMAQIQRTALRSQAADDYSTEQLAYMTASERDRPLVPAAWVEASDHVYIIAHNDEDPVGYGGVNIDDGILTATFVAPQVSGQGIGQTIAERLQEIARDHGIETLTTYASLNAVGFYRHLGFTEQDRVNVGNETAPEIPSVLMEKRL